MNLPQPPEGILDPQQPWHLPMPKSPGLWGTLKARLTGRPNEYGDYSSYVNITEADADRLIANMKKDPRGYPQLDQSTGTPSQWMERQRIYQEWLVEEYLEKPFREEVDRKIEERQNQKTTISTPSPQEEQRSREIELKDDTDDREIEKQVVQITEELDKGESNSDSNQSEQKQEKEEDKEKEKLQKDSSEIQDSLDKIKSSLSTQIAVTNAINSTNTNSVSTLSSLTELFKTQTDIVRREVELKARQEREASLEQTKDVSGSFGSTSTMDDGKAKGKIVKVDGDLLTVKSLEGSFKEGSTITQGDGGFDLMGMLKDIGSKIFGKGKMGGGSKPPMKLSSGGVLNQSTGSGKMIAPGIYDKPTRGNLAPGQAVIPLNRNIGKQLGNKKISGRDPRHQSFANSMQEPLKAVGLSIIANAGEFLSVMGPLAGFYKPYISTLLKPMSAILGVSSAIVESLVGGPASAATLEAEKQQNVFAGIWSDLMKKFGYIFGMPSEKDTNSRGGSSRPAAAGFKEASGGEWAKKDPEWVAKVNDVARELGVDAKYLFAIMDVETGGTMDPKARNPRSGATGLIQFLYPESVGTTFSALRQMTRTQQMDYVLKYFKQWGVKGPATGGDLYGAVFLPAYAKGASQDEVLTKAGEREYDGNSGLDANKDDKITKEDLQKKLDERASKYASLSAETGYSNSQGNLLDSFIIKGPNSGYNVSDNLTMHGEEMLLQYEKGFTILPIENRKFSLSSDPLKTLSHWDKLMNSPSMKMTPKMRGGYASGGKVTLYAGHADMLRNSPGGLGTNGGSDGGAPLMSQANGYFTNEAYLNDKIAAAAASKSGGHAVYKSPIRTLNGSDRNSNWERGKKDIQDGNYPIELHHDAETGKPGVITSSVNAAKGNKFFKSVHDAYGFYRTGDEGFVSRGGMILELDALKEPIRKNPSGWISSASTKLANAIRKAANMEEVSGSDAETNTGDSAEPAEQTPVDPFEAMESAIKNLGVSLGLLSAIDKGDVKSKEDYTRIKADLQAKVDSVPSTPAPAPQVTPTAGTQQTPAVMVRGTSAPMGSGGTNPLTAAQAAIDIQTARQFA